MGRRLGTCVARAFNPVSICWSDCIMGGIPPEKAEAVGVSGSPGGALDGESLISSGKGGSELGI